MNHITTVGELDYRSYGTLTKINMDENVLNANMALLLWSRGMCHIYICGYIIVLK